MARAVTKGANVVVSVDPGTLEEVGRVAAASPADVKQAVKDARAAQPAWAARSMEDRLVVLRRFQRAFLASKRDVATVVSREAGKPLVEAISADVVPVLDAVRWLADHGLDVLAGERFRNHLILAKDRVSAITYEPLGVVGIIAPWNYPVGIPAAQVVFALFAGNAVVLKPSELTPLSAEAFVRLLHEAGVPEDVVALVHGPGEPVGRTLAKADVDAMIFTGSVGVGRQVEKACAARGIKACLELGGSDPAIIFDDANLDLAASGITWSRFANAGQTCASMKRALVAANVHDRFVAALVAKVERLRVGYGLDPGVDVGALKRGAAVAEMEAFVADAVEKGARIATGGKPLDRVGQFFAPTVLVDVPPDARVLTEEVFGPILPVVRFNDEDEAVRIANDTPFGLTASVWTRDKARADRIAPRLDCGTVTVNDATYTFALLETPWSGRKDSGHGVTHGRDGLLELVKMKHVNYAPSMRPLKELWWYPYEDDAVDTWEKGLDFLYGSAADKAKQALPVTARLLKKKNL